jgi:predicted nucleic acid-binding protein
MNLFVDTSVWSAAFRKDAARGRSVERLRLALTSSDLVFTTGLVLQELLQRFAGPKARDSILVRFDALTNIVPDTEDYLGAAELRNTCRRKGIQVGTIDALFAQICIRRKLVMLTEDADFAYISKHHALELWS